MSITYTTPLATLAEESRTGACWWVSVARALDEFLDRLTAEGAVDDGPSGAFGQAVSREPGLANVARRVSAERAALISRARRLRQRVAIVAGDHVRASDVSAELSALARREERYLVKSRSVFWDSFNRDIGGG